VGESGVRGAARAILTGIGGTDAKTDRGNSGNNRDFHGLDRPRNVRQIERAKLFRNEIEPPLNIVPHLSRDTDAAWRTLGLKPCRYIRDIAVDIRAIWNHIANIDADAEADGSIRGLVVIMDPAEMVRSHRVKRAGDLYLKESLPSDSNTTQIIIT
jgi:hypothetical protein